MHRGGIGRRCGGGTADPEGRGAPLAIEFDRNLVPALREVVGDLPGVHVEVADAMRADWCALLGDGPWTFASNLPYNVATPIVMRILEEVPAITRLLVMVQREVG